MGEDGNVKCYSVKSRAISQRESTNPQDVALRTRTRLGARKYSESRAVARSNARCSMDSRSHQEH